MSFKRWPFSSATIISGGAVLSSVFCLGGNYYVGKWSSALLAASTIVAISTYRKFGAPVAAAVFYCLCSAIWIGSTNNRYVELDPENLGTMHLYSFEAAFKLLLVLAPLLLLDIDTKKARLWGRVVCVVFFLWSAGRFFVQFLSGGCDEVNACGGALSNPSMNVAAMATVLPLMPCSMIAAVLAAAIAMISKSSIGIGMVASFLLLRAILARSWWLLAAVPLIFLIGHHTHGYKALFDSSGRFQEWQFFMKKWAEDPRNLAFGTGMGTFGVYSLKFIKESSENGVDWWPWLHNEWLEQIFTGGITGLALLVWLFISGARNLIRSKMMPEFQCLILFGVMMGCNFPLHIAPTVILGAWLLVIGIEAR